MNRFYCFLLLVLAALATATRFSPCRSASGKVYNVNVSGCPDGSPTCSLGRGSKNISIKFQAYVATPVVNVVVSGVAAPFGFPLPLKDNNGCTSGVTCPTESGGIYTYNYTFDVWYDVARVPFILRWELRDFNLTDLVCVKIPCN